MNATPDAVRTAAMALATGDHARITYRLLDGTTGTISHGIVDRRSATLIGLEVPGVGRVAIPVDEVVDVDRLGSDGRTVDETLAALEPYGVTVVDVDAFAFLPAVDQLLEAVAVLANRHKGGANAHGVADAIATVLDRARHLSHCRVVAAYPPPAPRGLPGE